MKELVQEAIQMIQDIGDKQSLFIHQILCWDDEMKQAFMLAYRLLKDENDE